MSTFHRTFLNAEAVRGVALPLLHQRLAAFDFTDVSVVEEDDFDGSSVLRMTAEVNAMVPADALISTTADIHDALRQRGDDRFVYLSTHRHTDDETDEDEE